MRFKFNHKFNKNKSIVISSYMKEVLVEVRDRGIFHLASNIELDISLGEFT